MSDIARLCDEKGQHIQANLETTLKDISAYVRRIGKLNKNIKDLIDQSKLKNDFSELRANIHRGCNVYSDEKNAKKQLDEIDKFLTENEIKRTYSKNGKTINDKNIAETIIRVLGSKNEL